MKIIIEKQSTVGAVKQQFCSVFPFLKLEVFKKNTTHGHTSLEQTVAPDTAFIQDIQPLVCTGSLEFDHNTRVCDVESELASRFLLTAQVFRRSKNVWLETSATDNWTLGQQNEHGKNMTEHPANPAEEIEDYELQRDAD